MSNTSKFLLSLSVVILLGLGWYGVMLERASQDALQLLGIEQRGITEGVEIQSKKIDDLQSQVGNLWSVEDLKDMEVETDVFGAGYTPVTGYQARTTQFMSAGASTIPVNTTRDLNGRAVQLSEVSSSSTPRVYFTIEPDVPTKTEIFYCTAVSATTWSGCVGGLDFQGGSNTASSTLQKTHNAGSKVIISNVGQFYTEFVSINGTQTINDVKTFSSFPAVTNTSALPVSNGQLATKLYVDNVGAGGFTSSNVSSTLGLQAISSGVPNCSSAAACAGIYASDTASDNGGFLNFVTSTNERGRLFWDVRSFIAKTWSWGGVQTFASAVLTTFTGSATADGLQVTTAADSASDAVNKSFMDSQIPLSYATGTAGVTIAAGNALYISTTGTLFLADADATSTANRFVGIAITAGAAEAQISFAKPGGVVANQSGLASGSTYYVSATAGALATTPGTVPIRVGIALSANRLLILSPSRTARSSGSETVTFNGSPVAVTTNWIPTKVNLACGGNAGNSIGYAVVNSNGGKTQSSTGYDATDDTAFQSATLACNWEESTNIFTVSIATSTSGFTLTPATVGGDPTRTILWTAETDDTFILP